MGYLMNSFLTGFCVCVCACVRACVIQTPTYRIPQWLEFPESSNYAAASQDNM